MKSITSIYLKLFLAYGLIFGMLMSLWDYLDKGEISFLKTIFMIVFFGGFMSWTSVKNMKRSKQRFVGAELSEDDFNAKQTELISKNKPIEEIFDLLKSNEMTKSWSLKIENSRIIGKTKASWSSWGERIIISESNDKIKIESNPMLRTTLYDDGKNRENVLFLKRLIEK